MNQAQSHTRLYASLVGILLILAVLIVPARATIDARASTGTLRAPIQVVIPAAADIPYFFAVETTCLFPEGCGFETLQIYVSDAQSGSVLAVISAGSSWDEGYQFFSGKIHASGPITLTMSTSGEPSPIGGLSFFRILTQLELPDGSPCPVLPSPYTNGLDGSTSFVCTQNVPLSIPTSQLTNAVVGDTGQSQQQMLSAIGGLPPYRWNLVGGAEALPPGLILYSSGILQVGQSFTPNRPLIYGTYPITVAVQDSSPTPQQAQATLSLTIVCGMTTGCQTTPIVTPQKSLGKCGCKGGDPVDIGSGNLFEQTTDYTTVGLDPLAFTRSYNSLADSTTAASALGKNWRSNFDRFLNILSPASIVAERADGQKLNFSFDGTFWSADADTDLQLIQNGTGVGSNWTLTDQSDTTEIYTTISTGEAILTSIQLRNGYTQSLQYDSQNNLVAVVDSFGRTLQFTNKNGLLSTMTTPEGTTITFGYGGAASNALTSVSYSSFTSASPTSISYLYEDPSFPYALTGILDQNGKRFTSWAYDTSERVVSSQHAGGADVTTFAYNDTDGSRVITNPLGEQETYHFQLLQGIPKVFEVDRAADSTVAAASRSFTYDDNGYQESQTDWNGNLTSYINDAHGQPTTITEADGSTVERTTTFTYHPTFHLPTRIVQADQTTDLTYDDAGNLLTRTLTDTTTGTAPYATSGQTRTTTFSWSNYGLPASIKSSRTDVDTTTSYIYDSSGVLTKSTNAVGQSIQVTQHTSGGLPQAMVDANGVTTEFSYDERQRLTARRVSTSAGTLTTQFAYDSVGDLLSTTLPDGSSLTNAYDDAHRLIKVTDSDGSYTNYTLDAFGDRTQSSIYNSGGTLSWQQSATFDSLGRQLVQTSGAGQAVTRTYDANGNVLTVADGLSQTTTDSYDALNRLSTTTDANDAVTTTAYDSEGRPVSVEDANGNSTVYTRDGFGDVIEQDSPDSGITVFHYDNEANLISKTDARGIVTNQTFDAINRPLTTTYPAHAAENVTYSYDQSGDGFGFGVGRLTSVSDAVGSLTRHYDERGNLLAEKRLLDSSSLTAGYSYDGANRMTSMTYPDGTLITYKHDPAGYVSSVQAVLMGGTAPTTIATMTHQPFGPVAGVTYGNGVSEARIYDLAYEPTRILDTLKGEYIQNLYYNYDPAANVSSIVDTVNNANTQTFSYDATNRLTSATSGAGGYGSFSWTYDDVGNRLSQVQGTTITNYGYTAGTNRLATLNAAVPEPTYVHQNCSVLRPSCVPSEAPSTSPCPNVVTNANGNITNIPSANGASCLFFTYNDANRPSSVTGGTAAASYIYDWSGQRYSKTNGGMPATIYSYAQDGSVAAENDGGTITDYVYVEGRPIAVLQPGTSVAYNQVAYVVDDRLGTPQLVTNDSGSIVWAASYQPFGTTAGTDTAAITQNLRFPGQLADAETGFSYNLNRDYMPNLGRYLESDPIGIVGGANTFSYASLRPTYETDRKGDIAGLDNAIGAGIAFGFDLTAQIIEARASGKSFCFDWKRSLFATGIGFATSGVSAFLPATVASAALLGGVASIVQTAALNKFDDHHDPYLEGAILGSAFGSLGAVVGNQLSDLGSSHGIQAFLDEGYAVGKANLLDGIARLSGATVTRQSPAFLVLGNSFGNFISNIPAFSDSINQEIGSK